MGTSLDYKQKNDFKRGCRQAWKQSPIKSCHWLTLASNQASNSFSSKKKKKACLSFFKPVQAMSSHLLTKLTDSNIRKEQD